MNASANATAVVIGKTVSGLDVVQRPNGGLKIGKAVIGPKAADRFFYQCFNKNLRPNIDGTYCVSCKAPHGMFTTSHRRAGPELVVITMTCAMCGVKDIDYLD